MALAIFRPHGVGSRLYDAAAQYLTEYVYDDGGNCADHELTETERNMVQDFLAGMFSDEAFSAVLQEMAAGMKAAGLDPEGPDDDH